MFKVFKYRYEDIPYKEEDCKIVINKIHKVVNDRYIKGILCEKGNCKQIWPEDCFICNNVINESFVEYISNTILGKLHLLHKLHRIRTAAYRRHDLCNFYQVV